MWTRRSPTPYPGPQAPAPQPCGERGPCAVPASCRPAVSGGFSTPPPTLPSPSRRPPPRLSSPARRARSSLSASLFHLFAATAALSTLAATLPSCPPLPRALPFSPALCSPPRFPRTLLAVSALSSLSLPGSHCFWSPFPPWPREIASSRGSCMPPLPSFSQAGSGLPGAPVGAHEGSTAAVGWGGGGRAADRGFNRRDSGRPAGLRAERQRQHRE